MNDWQFPAGHRLLAISYLSSILKKEELFESPPPQGKAEMTSPQQAIKIFLILLISGRKEQFKWSGGNFNEIFYFIFTADLRVDLSSTFTYSILAHSISLVVQAGLHFGGYIFCHQIRNTMRGQCGADRRFLFTQITLWAINEEWRLISGCNQEAGSWLFCSYKRNILVRRANKNS